MVRIDEDVLCVRDLLQRYGEIEHHLVKGARDLVQGPRELQAQGRKRKEPHAPSACGDPGSDERPTRRRTVESRNDGVVIPEDVALAILLGNVASRIDPTGELYMKLCSSFQMEAAEPVQMPDFAADVRDASLSHLLAHLKSMGLSDLVRRIQDRIVSAIPTALTTQRFRPVQWKLGGVLGKGAFGECRMALCEDTGALFAVKIVPLGGPESCMRSTVHSLQRELEVLLVCMRVGVGACGFFCMCIRVLLMMKAFINTGYMYIVICM